MYRIIIADDEVIERTVLAKKLKGYFGDAVDVFQARNGREVLALYEEKPADIYVLDIEMPGVSGLDAAEKIRERDRACAIIFLTAFDEFSYARKAIAVRATDYLLKPCDDSELVAAVEEGMRSCDMRKAQLGSSAAVKSGNSGSEASSGKGQQERIADLVKNNYMNDISVADMAAELGYSEAYFCKLFKQYFGQSFVSYLTEYRVKEAIKLFADPDMSVKEIGQAVGYADSNYFAKVFKRVTGQSPTEYRTSGKN